MRLKNKMVHNHLKRIAMEKEKRTNTNTKLEIQFEENLSDSSIEMIKKILWDSMGFKTKIEELEE